MWKIATTFYVGVSKPWLFVAIQLYWNFKLYFFYFFFQILHFQIRGAAYLRMRLIHGRLWYLVFIKFPFAKLIKFRHCNQNLSLPAQAKFHYFPFLYNISPYSCSITICIVTQCLFMGFVLLESDNKPSSFLLWNENTSERIVCNCKFFLN